MVNALAACNAAIPGPLKDLLGKVPPLVALPCAGGGAAPGGSVTGGISQNPLNPAPALPNPGSGVNELDRTLGGILKAGG
jgi:hypothetical protein